MIQPVEKDSWKGWGLSKIFTKKRGVGWPKTMGKGRGVQEHGTGQLSKIGSIQVVSR